jgi:subtilisin family serine protease
MERPNEKANSILARDSLLTLTLGPPAAAAGTISYLLRTPTANLVTVAAPGEGLLTPYLGSHYAAVWGTSFSTGLVSGAAAALVNAADDNTRHQIMFNDVQRALSNANAASSANRDLGAGCLDLIQATHYIHDTRVPTRHHYSCPGLTGAKPSVSAPLWASQGLQRLNARVTVGVL